MPTRSRKPSRSASRRARSGAPAASPRARPRTSPAPSAPRTTRSTCHHCSSMPSTVPAGSDRPGAVLLGPLRPGRDRIVTPEPLTVSISGG
ncbi:hypothetical protein [Ornithinimicrobium kibberense]|uniref:hypothetical protein n=1 Tax=Ornithinimicrobium kibberense TaxID=282060 RepID=UPI00360F899D